MPIAVVSYTAVPKYLKLNALYYYMNQQTAPNIYKNRHRYQLGATFSYPVHRFSLSLNSRFESTYTIGTAKPSNKWRNKILLSYTIPDSRWTPFIHTDIFLFLNGKQSGELDRIWYDAGVEYRIDKKNSIECKVREEHLMSKTPQQLNTFISLGYKIETIIPLFHLAIHYIGGGQKNDSTNSRRNGEIETSSRFNPPKTNRS